MRFLPLPPVLLAILAIGILSVMDMLVRMAGQRLNVFQLTGLRFVSGSLWALGFWLALRPSLPSREAMRINLTRGSIVTISATAFFYALQTLPLAEAIAFSFLSPLFLAGLGALVLGEKLDRRIGVALVLGFGGMGIMAWGNGLGSGHLPALGVAAAVASAGTYALSLILLRQRAQQDALVTIVLFQNLVPGLLLFVPALLVWEPLTLREILLFAAMGGLGVTGHYVMGLAFSREEAARLAPAEYSALLYAVTFGYIAFGEVPGWATLLGSALIAIGVGFTFRRKKPPAPSEAALGV